MRMNSIMCTGDQKGSKTHRSMSIHMRSSQGLNRRSSGSACGAPAGYDQDVTMQQVDMSNPAAVGEQEELNMPVAGMGTPTKSRRAAARRSDVFRQQLLSPSKGAGGSVGGLRSVESPGKAARASVLRSPQLVNNPSSLAWESTRTRTRSTKPRKRFSPILRRHRHALLTRPAFSLKNTPLFAFLFPTLQEHYSITFPFTICFRKILCHCACIHDSYCHKLNPSESAVMHAHWPLPGDAFYLLIVVHMFTVQN
jgi:hypothetical protein